MQHLQLVDVGTGGQLASRDCARLGNAEVYSYGCLVIFRRELCVLFIDLIHSFDWCIC